MSRTSFPKRSIELRDVLLILLGWTVHKVLDFVVGTVKKQRTRNRQSKQSRKPVIQMIDDLYLKLLIRMLYDDPEEAKKVWEKHMSMRASADTLSTLREVLGQITSQNLQLLYRPFDRSRLKTKKTFDTTYV